MVESTRRPTTTLPSTVTQMFVVGADHSMLECTLYGAADHRTVSGGTQWMMLSAAVEKKFPHSGSRRAHLELISNLLQPKRAHYVHVSIQDHGIRK